MLVSITRKPPLAVVVGYYSIVLLAMGTFPCATQRRHGPLDGARCQPSNIVGNTVTARARRNPRLPRSYRSVPDDPRDARRRTGRLLKSCISTRPGPRASGGAGGGRDTSVGGQTSSVRPGPGTGGGGRGGKACGSILTRTARKTASRQREYELNSATDSECACVRTCVRECVSACVWGVLT